MTDLFQLAEALQENYPSRLPPVDSWNPPLCGTIDIRIARDGRWYHEGREIKRFELVKLFSSILKREEDGYYLVTPVEKWRITVDDAPFVVVDFSRRGRGADQALMFKTWTDDIVVADAAHPLWVEHRGAGDSGRREEPLPYILIRGNLPGLINRNVYYRLVDLALADSDAGVENGDAGKVTIRSRGVDFSLAG